MIISRLEILFHLKMSLVRDQALGWGISTSLIFSDLNFAQVCYWDIARIEVIVNNLFGRWNGEFIELGFDHQTILHCDHNCDHKLSKGNLECFYFLFLRDHSSITSAKRWVGGVRKWQLLLIYSTIYADVGG